jgi:hypothetical protein
VGASGAFFRLCGFITWIREVPFCMARGGKKRHWEQLERWEIVVNDWSRRNKGLKIHTRRVPDQLSLHLLHIVRPPNQERERCRRSDGGRRADSLADSSWETVPKKTAGEREKIQNTWVCETLER